MFGHHNKRDGDIENNAATGRGTGYDGAGRGTRPLSRNYDNNAPLPGTPVGTAGSGTGRYHTHSRSLERKPVPGRVSGEM